MDKKLKIRIIIALVLTAFIFAISAIKVIRYFSPENIDFDKSQVPVSQVNPDMESLCVMPFNGELVVACQEMILVNSNDKCAEINFVSPESNKVLVRAEFFVDMDNLGRKPNKVVWSKFFGKQDEKLVRIADTGWVRSGEMIENIKFDELPKCSCDVKVRFSAVNPANTNISAGQFSMETNLVVADFKGQILDNTGKWIEVNN